MAMRPDVNKLLTTLSKLEKASAGLEVSFEQVAESAVAKRVPGFSRAVKKEELKKLIDSGKEDALKLADDFLNHWLEVVNQANDKRKKSPVTSPSSQDLRQAQGTPKEKPPTTEELNELRKKLEAWGEKAGVPFEQAAGAFKIPTTKESLQKTINATNEDSRRGAALFLDTWAKQIKVKATEIKSMQGATPKQTAPPKDMKVVEKSVAEDLGLSGDEQYAQHNEWRKRYNKPPLQYDKRLADHTQQWANYLAQQAMQKHNPNRMVEGFSSKAGENIYFPSWMGMTPTKQSFFKQAVDGWGNEVSDYDFTTHEPKTPGKMVGHFTQLIWRDTTRVGCGYASVTGPDGWTHGYVVCNYHPAANVTNATPGADPKAITRRTSK
jgi:uncharacterized protein YkwD